MNREELLKLIKGGETQEVEFKESFQSNQDISKIICSFANTDGGFLFLGISKNGEIKGVKGDLDKLQQDIANSGQNIFSPPLISTTLHNFDGKQIALIEIIKANDKNAHTFNGAV